MGCCSSDHSAKINVVVTERDALRSTEDNSVWHLKGFNLVWFDPNVNNEENKVYQKNFSKKFASTKYCTTPESTIREFKIDDMPIVVVSNGENYPNIQAEVEKAKNVSRVFIFCNDVRKYKHFTEQSKNKIVVVSNNFKVIVEELKKVESKNPRLERFFATREENSFFTIKDKDTIKSALTNTVGNEGYSIFYPIGFKAVKLGNFLSKRKLDEIMKVAREDKRLTEYLENIELRINELKQELTMESLLRSYTGQGLYNYFNLYIRFGNYESFKLFSEYLLCLKGCLIEIGIPLSTVNIDCVYRGMSLSESDLKKWIEAATSNEQIKRFGLFPAFTSTTTDVSVADYFINLERGRLKNQTERKLVKLIMKLEENAVDFYEFLKKFEFAEESGILYPADISHHSLYFNEKEVLFPPFYPFKISNIIVNDGLICIHLIVPKQLCFSSIKHSENKWRMPVISNIWTKEYLDKTIDLVEKNLSTDITLCILSSTLD